MTGCERAMEALRSAGCEAKHSKNWHCPAHEDRTPSLSVTPAPGKVLLHCHAGCPTEAVVTALGLKMVDLYDERGRGDRRLVDVYEYVNSEGDVEFEVVRRENKRFSQRQMGPDGEWIWNRRGTRNLLYRLPELLEELEKNK